jgi:hypothetical protein
MKDNNRLIAGDHILRYKMPQKSPFSRGGLKLLISLILHDKARFCPSGMKIAERPMTMVSELRRGIEQD